MNEPAAITLFSTRDGRILLGVCAAAVCWRWMLSMRVPVPDLQALRDLRVGAEVAAGNLGALADVWAGPWWSAMVALAGTLGFDTFEAAKLLGCVFGGLAVMPIACVAQRLRAGGGVAAALLLFTIPGPTLAAAGGSAIGLHMLWGGFAVWALVAKRYVVAVSFALITIADVATSGADAFGDVPQFLLALLTLPMLGVLVVLAVGLAFLPVRIRDLLLTGTLGWMLYASWNDVEARSPVIERELGILVAERLADGQDLITTYPRVAFHAGQRPVSEALTVRQLSDLLDDDETVAAVFRAVQVRDLEGWLSKWLAKEGYVRFQLSPQLDDLARAHGVVVYFRRE